MQAERFGIDDQIRIWKHVAKKKGTVYIVQMQIVYKRPFISLPCCDAERQLREVKPLLSTARE
jgi:hypothetical protein